MCHLGSAFCVRFDLSKKTGGATSKYSVQKKFEESAIKNKNFIYICMEYKLHQFKNIYIGHEVEGPCELLYSCTVLNR